MPRLPLATPAPPVTDAAQISASPCPPWPPCPPVGRVGSVVRPVQDWLHQRPEEASKSGRRCPKSELGPIYVPGTRIISLLRSLAPDLQPWGLKSHGFNHIRQFGLLAVRHGPTGDVWRRLLLSQSCKSWKGSIAQSIFIQYCIVHWHWHLYIFSPSLYLSCFDFICVFVCWYFHILDDHV